MLFTEYKFDPAFITQLTEERRQGLQSNRGLSNQLAFCVQVIAQRLAPDPRRYLDYGPYWWAVKDILRDHGYDLGAQSDPFVMQEYVFPEAVETLIAADLFRSELLGTSIIGTNKFILNGVSGSFYSLFDEDMESMPKKYL